MFLQVKPRAHLCVQSQTQLTRKRRVQAFLVFDNIRQRLHQLQPDITSSLLQELISALPNVSDKIQQIQALFNVDVLSKNADAIQPREGTDRDYEAAKSNRTTAEKALHELLFREKTALQCSKMKFSGSGKDPWLLEMPADFTKRGGECLQTMTFRARPRHVGGIRLQSYRSCCRCWLKRRMTSK